MMFASKTPRDLNHDPEPWHVSLTPSRGANGRWREWRGEATDWDDALVRAEEAHSGWSAHTGGMIPRPEFDHVQHNKPNPILSFILRDAVEQDAAENPPILDIRDTARYVLEMGLEAGEYDEAHTPEQIEHAREVLSRIQAVDWAEWRA